MVCASLASSNRIITSCNSRRSRWISTSFCAAVSPAPPRTAASSSRAALVSAASWSCAAFDSPSLACARRSDSDSV
eukprot:CAMPEP_0182579948 /NCGR_PEP_ID=MMETSP1324-20130603/45570_1 /TAXON_ID=236786 /ORGANISM="Florenciella sp., Strain RCC1587" /LENGTH=75 /DNA_ID=CAMNT_0024796117 /DNA_START=110 /DNA_END=334 /DNA_ORIENTATION=+